MKHGIHLVMEFLSFVAAFFHTKTQFYRVQAQSYYNNIEVVSSIFAEVIGSGS